MILALEKTVNQGSTEKTYLLVQCSQIAARQKNKTAIYQGALSL